MAESSSGDRVRCIHLCCKSMVVFGEAFESDPEFQAGMTYRVLEPSEREDGMYRRWLDERHEGYVDYQRLKHRQQEAYWRWRHEHPDTMLWPNER